jgi:hypothetical protein
MKGTSLLSRHIADVGAAMTADALSRHGGALTVFDRQLAHQITSTV